MTPAQFIAKWSQSELKERSAAQSHFNDLCRLIGVETPAEAERLRPGRTIEAVTEEKLDLVKHNLNHRQIKKRRDSRLSYEAYLQQLTPT